MPTDHDYCADLAREINQIALTCKDTQVRESLLNMARQLMATAMDETKVPRDKTLTPK